MWYNVRMELFSAEKYRAKRICVALSGGVDSVCLLHALHMQAERYGLMLTAVHVEHGIRGEESLRDAAFCEALCSEWGIPLTVEHTNIPALAAAWKVGIEEMARTYRYEHFTRLVKSGQCDAVATAHHRGDVAETVLFRLARGTALVGMHAIIERPELIRPMLGVSKDAILAYAEHYGLSYVEDSSNGDENYTRNFIRHEVLPVFSQISNGAEEHLVRFATLAARDDDYLYSLARKSIEHLGDEARIPADLPAPLLTRACLLCMEEEKDYTSAAIKEALKLATLQSGRRVTLASGREAAREYDSIVFYTPKEQDMRVLPFTPEAGAYFIGGREFCVDTAAREGALRVDLDAFPEGCVVRTRREGDVITPYHARRKTLKKFLTDRKISARAGKNLPLIARGEEILAVVGVEISDSVKITDTTARVGYLI